MEASEYNNVCRLCLGSDDQLIDVFDKEYEDRLPKRISVTTGVEILSIDFVSQKICCKCHDMVIEAWNFRKNSIRNDRFLKKEYFDLTTTKSVEKLSDSDVKMIASSQPVATVQPIAPVQTIKVQPDATAQPVGCSRTEKLHKPVAVFKALESSSHEANSEIISKIIPTKIHPSISQVLAENPKLKISASCLQFNVNPYVCLEKGQVSNYFRERQLDFQTQVRMSQTQEVQKNCLSNKEEKENSNLLYHNNNMQNLENACNDFETDKTRADVKRLAEDDSPGTCAKKSKVVEPLVDVHILHDVRRGIPALVCDLCNAVCYNRRDLRRHKQKHSRCQFCKLNLPSMERKEEHLKSSCKVKSAMLNANAITIPLNRLESEKDLLNRHPNVLRQLQLSGSSDRLEKRPPPEIIAGVIDISDDEEKPPVSIAALDQLQTPTEDIKTTVHASRIPDMTRKQVAVHESAQYNTVSIVKPEIFIRGSNVIDRYNGVKDIMALKDLIGKAYTTELQTIDTFEAIGEPLARLKSMQKQTQLYPIPVHVQKGEISASCEPHKSAKKKPLSLWDTTRPIKAKKIIWKKPFPGTNTVPTVASPVALSNSTMVVSTSVAKTSSVPNATTLISKITPETTATSSGMTTNEGTVMSKNQTSNPPNNVSAQQLQPNISVNANPNDKYYMTNGSGIINNFLLGEGTRSTTPINFITCNPLININWPPQAGYGVQGPQVFQMVPNSHFQIVPPTNQSDSTGIQSSNSSHGTVLSTSSTSKSSKNLTILNNVIIANEEAPATAQGSQATESNVVPQGTIRVKPMWELK